MEGVRFDPLAPLLQGRDRPQCAAARLGVGRPAALCSRQHHGQRTPARFPTSTTSLTELPTLQPVLKEGRTHLSR